MPYKKILLALLAAALILINPMVVFAAQMDSSQGAATRRNDAMKSSTNNQGQTMNRQASMHDARSEAVNKVRAATRVFNDIQSNRESRIPGLILQKASAVAIIPGMAKPAWLPAGGMAPACC